MDRWLAMADSSMRDYPHHMARVAEDITQSCYYTCMLWLGLVRHQMLCCSEPLTLSCFCPLMLSSQVQHDVHELITLLLDIIDQNYKKTANAELVSL